MRARWLLALPFLVAAAAGALHLLAPAPSNPTREGRFAVASTSTAELGQGLSVVAEFQGELGVSYTGPKSARVEVVAVKSAWVEAAPGDGSSARDMDARRSRVPLEGLLHRAAEVDLETGSFAMERGSEPELSVEAAELLRLLALQVPPEPIVPGDGPATSPVGVVRARYEPRPQNRGWVRTASEGLAWAGDPSPPHATDHLDERWELRVAAGRRQLTGELRLEREVMGSPMVVGVRWSWKELDAAAPTVRAWTSDEQRPISGPARVLPAEQVALGRANANREASAGLDLPKVLLGLRGMVGPLQASDDRFLWRATAYFKLHPDELPVLLSLFSEQIENRKNPAAVLSLLAAVGSSEAQSVFWQALSAHGGAVRGDVLADWLTVASTLLSPSDETLSALERYLEHPSPRVRERSSLALGATAGFAAGSPAADRAVAELERRWSAATTAAEKELAVTALGNAAQPSSLPLIEEAARSEHWPVRARSAGAFIKYPAESAQPSLVTLLGDVDRGVRERTHIAIDEHLAGGAPLLPGTEQAVLQQARAGLDTGAMAAAVRILGRSSSPEARTALEQIARSPAASPGLRAEVRRILTRG